MSGHGWTPPEWLDGGSAFGEHEVPLVAHPYSEQFDRADWESR